MSVGPRTRRLLIVALPILAAGLLVLRPGRGAPATRVETGEVARRVAFQSTVAGSGEIVPARYAEIGSGAMGKIVTLPVAEGDRVTSGQLLARIDPVQAESDVSSAQAQLGALKAEARAAADAVRTATSDLAAAEARERDLAQQYARRRQ
ncbi:MAG: biotin/lipoyl-binding protein, partial [Acidimicrobiia bacterium]|nr:biotin/lipoyl-binding protein [Acidimicrobiia bacterium]